MSSSDKKEKKDVLDLLHDFMGEHSEIASLYVSFKAAPMNVIGIYATESYDATELMELHNKLKSKKDKEQP